jgi:hypothetical protein
MKQREEIRVNTITELLDRLVAVAESEDKDRLSAIKTEMVEMRSRVSDTDRQSLDRMIDKCTWAIRAIETARKKEK